MLCRVKYHSFVTDAIISKILHFIADVDECSASVPECDFNADCQNTRGSYHCTCKTGFTGEGKTCTGKGVAEESSRILNVEYHI